MINLYLVYCIYKLDIMKKLLLLFIGLTVISCGGSDDDSSSEIDQSAELIGAWQKNFEALGSDPTNNYLISQNGEPFPLYTFDNDGTITITQISPTGDLIQYYSYVVSGPGTYTMTGYGYTYDYEYKIEGNTLTLTEPTNEDDTVISKFVRVE